MTIAELSPDALTARLYDLRHRERHLLVEFLRHLAELDRRNVVLGLGFSSIFDFLRKHLGYSKASAWRRQKAAELLGRFPVIADHLADGRIGLTALLELRDVLTEENVHQLLERATGKDDDEVKLLVASLAPREAVSDLLRRLPMRGPSSAVEPAVPPTAAPPSSPKPARVEPISEDLSVLRMTVGKRFAENLEEVRQYLSHEMPGATLAQILGFCLELAREHLEKKRRGAGQPMRMPGAPGSRYVPAAVRDEIFRRDGGRCTFVGTTGRRCESTHQLEIHHVVPFARGGPTIAENLTLLCARHNRFLAERDFACGHDGRRADATPTCPQALLRLPGV